MPDISFLKPLDQPLGRQRVADWISKALRSGRFQKFRLIVSFVRQGALLRMLKDLKRFRDRGGTIEAVFGIDLRLTSKQALEFAIDNFDRVFVWDHPSPMTTFHPKVYLLEGRGHAEAYVGSGNLTVGGLQTNCESVARIAYSLPSESSEWRKAKACWEDLLGHGNLLPLNRALLSKLDSQGLLCDETITGRLDAAIGASRDLSVARANLFPYTAVVPPSSLPRGTVKQASRSRRIATASAPLHAASPEGLVIQIIPHHNSEVLLSKLAVNQYPAFLGLPFKGLTTPKRSTNKPYPQRVPDPITAWRVFNRHSKIVAAHPRFPMNTVLYERKGEVRITIPPEIARQIPEFSILHMTATGEPLDYICDVFPPGSKEYQELLKACTQTMPSGGSSRARKFGWI